MVKELFTAFSQQSPKDSLNKFYIGPLISHPSNVKMDKWTNALSITAAQKQNSRLGEPYLKGTPSSSGETSLVPEISKKGVFPNPEDIAIVGRYNTDIGFRYEGVFTYLMIMRVLKYRTGTHKYLFVQVSLKRL